jgi:hypothetical protein
LFSFSIVNSYISVPFYSRVRKKWFVTKKVKTGLSGYSRTVQNEYCNLHQAILQNDKARALWVL